jgi:hypothetical protein
MCGGQLRYSRGKTAWRAGGRGVGGGWTAGGRSAAGGGRELSPIRPAGLSPGDEGALTGSCGGVQTSPGGGAGQARGGSPSVRRNAAAARSNAATAWSKKWWAAVPGCGRAGRWRGRPSSCLLPVRSSSSPTAGQPGDRRRGGEDPGAPRVHSRWHGAARLQGVTLELRAELANGNPFPLPAGRLDCAISLAGAPVARVAGLATGGRGRVVAGARRIRMARRPRCRPGACSAGRRAPALPPGVAVVRLRHGGCRGCPAVG